MGMIPGFDIGGTANAVIGVVWAVIQLLLVLGVTGGVVYYLLKVKRYGVGTVTIETDPETGTIRGVTLSKGGTFVDSKTKNKRFFLKGTNVGLDPDKTPELPVFNAGMFSPKKVVLMVKSGFKSYRYLRPYITQDKQFDFSVGEEDVNWGINAYQKQKALYGTSWWDKLMPYMGAIITSVFMFLIVIYVFKQLPEMKEILILIKDIVDGLAKANMGTVVSA